MDESVDQGFVAGDGPDELNIKNIKHFFECYQVFKPVVNNQYFGNFSHHLFII